MSGLLPCPKMGTISTQTKRCLQRRQPQLSFFQHLKTPLQISHRSSREIIGSLQLASTLFHDFRHWTTSRCLKLPAYAEPNPKSSPDEHEERQPRKKQTDSPMRLLHKSSASTSTSKHMLPRRLAVDSAGTVQMTLSHSSGASTIGS